MNTDELMTAQLKKDQDLDYYIYDTLGAFTLKLNGTVEGSEDIPEIDYENKKYLVERIINFHNEIVAKREAASKRARLIF